MSIGFIYMASNAAMPGLYKIGSTARSPSLRVRELSAPTPVAEPFQLEYFAEVSNPGLVEKEIHRLLSDFRPNPSREFFTIKPSDFYDWIYQCDIVMTEWAGCDACYQSKRGIPMVPYNLPTNTLSQYRE